MSKLEIQHIAPYLPFGLKFLPIYYNENKKLDTLFYLSDLRDHKSYSGVNGYTSNNIKPVLRPLSDLTKEIEVNGERFVPLSKIKQIRKRDWIYFQDEDEFCEFFHYENHTANTYHGIFDLPYVIIQKLFEWHFDVFGLIEQGLAIDMNNSEIKDCQC